jgi:hypothetical protein
LRRQIDGLFVNFDLEEPIVVVVESKNGMLRLSDRVSDQDINFTSKYLTK